MFSLLTPFALWLAPLLAVPLVLHFMGRAEPKVRDFPSLRPVRESLQRAMRRHRLKNWLQLILRTLALLCLLLAAAGPVWRGGSALSPPAVAGLLRHNGAYAGLPVLRSGSQSVEAGTVGEQQDDLRAALDSLTAGNAVSEPLIPETERTSATPARYGHSAEGMARLLRRIGDQAGTGNGAPTHVFAPVFNATDLVNYAAVVRAWLESRPQARLILLDYTEETARLLAFGKVDASFGRSLEKGGMLTLRVATATRQAPVWNNLAADKQGGAAARTASLDGDTAAVAVPLPASDNNPAWVAGAFTLSEPDPLRATHAFVTVAAAFRIPPPAMLCHLGSRASFASLATLGGGGPRLRIAPLSGAEELDKQACRLLYLADPDNLDANLLARAATVVRSGGRLILEVGPGTDPVLWNRNLLVPLGVGRLTAIEKSAAPAAARARPEALSRLGVRGRDVDRWGKPGTVTTRLGFLPAAGTEVLLAAAAARGTTGNATGQSGQPGPESAPLLVHHRLGSGDILLWATSLSNPEWSDLGLGPWAALLHQAYLAQAWSADVEPRAVDTDSLLFIPSTTPFAEDSPPRVIDPDGKIFTRLRAEPGGWLAGPFDHPGLYRIEGRNGDRREGHGGSWFAAGLATPPPVPTGRDWEAFREALGESAWERTTRIDGSEDWRGLYGGFRLRLGLLLITALLLFAEGIVSLRLSPSRN